MAVGFENGRKSLGIGKGTTRKYDEDKVREFAKTHTIEEVVAEFGFTSSADCRTYFSLRNIHDYVRVNLNYDTALNEEEVREYAKTHFLSEISQKFTGSKTNAQTMAKYLKSHDIEYVDYFEKHRDIKEHAKNMSLEQLVETYKFESIDKARRYCNSHRIRYVGWTDRGRIKFKLTGRKKYTTIYHLRKAAGLCVTCESPELHKIYDSDGNFVRFGVRCDKCSEYLRRYNVDLKK